MAEIDHLMPWFQNKPIYIQQKIMGEPQIVFTDAISYQSELVRLAVLWRDSTITFKNIQYAKY